MKYVSNSTCHWVCNSHSSCAYEQFWLRLCGSKHFDKNYRDCIRLKRSIIIFYSFYQFLKLQQPCTSVGHPLICQHPLAEAVSWSFIFTLLQTDGEAFCCCVWTKFGPSTVFFGPTPRCRGQNRTDTNASCHWRLFWGHKCSCLLLWPSESPPVHPYTPCVACMYVCINTHPWHGVFHVPTWRRTGKMTGWKAIFQHTQTNRRSEPHTLSQKLPRVQ